MLKASADRLENKRVDVTIRGESLPDCVEWLHVNVRSRNRNDLHCHCSITSIAQMRTSRRTNERPNEMTVIDICILSTLNSYRILSNYLTGANVIMQNVPQDVGDVPIFCDPNQALRYAFSVPSIPKYVCHFPIASRNKELTFYGIIKGSKESHSPHTKNLYAPQRFPSGRVFRETTKRPAQPSFAASSRCIRFSGRDIDSRDERAQGNEQGDVPKIVLRGDFGWLLNIHDCPEQEEA